MNDSVRKGQELENAVLAIEKTILAKTDGLDPKHIKIEPRKIVSNDGVRHEIDLYVIIKLAKGYELLNIFECKNWSDRVGKNEIIVFSEKIRATRAQHGFFVAKSYTTDAIAQAKTNDRITLLEAVEHRYVELPFAMHFVENRDIKTNVTFIEKGCKGIEKINTMPFDIDDSSATKDGFPFNINDYVCEWRNRLIDKRSSKVPSATMEAGKYEFEINDTISFEDENLMINGRQIESAHLSGSFVMQISRAVIEFDFEVKGRGRALYFYPSDAMSLRLSVGFVEIES